MAKEVFDWINDSEKYNRVFEDLANANDIHDGIPVDTDIIAEALLELGCITAFQEDEGEDEDEMSKRKERIEYLKNKMNPDQLKLPFPEEDES